MPVVNGIESSAENCNLSHGRLVARQHNLAVLLFFGLPVQHDFLSDDLHDFTLGAGCEARCHILRILQAILKHGNLEQFVLLKRFIDGLCEFRCECGLSDLEKRLGCHCDSL